ncbi:hypothetical protein [Aquabacterium sp.]|uniref:hypothetical protein n=1 Tax=Aquabacterium sp. TaxID=1872578 RepID=UPI002487599B|nr:hypothetical protein [Aquabacterium sp.]MDI1260194.1 hypothetical protein [Aquabacterium sp.]
MKNIPEQAKPALAFIGTCMLAGPAIGVIFVYLMAALLLVGLSIWSLIQGAPSKGGPLIFYAFVGGLGLLPIFAMVGAIYTAPLTLATGVVLSIAHYAKLVERSARHLHLPPLALQLVFGFSVGLTLTMLLGYKKLPEVMNSLLGMHIVAGFSSALCMPIATHVLGRFQKAKAHEEL